MIRVNFGLHYSDVYASEKIALEELMEFIVEQYEDNIGDPNKLTTKEMFVELGWEFEEIK